MDRCIRRLIAERARGCKIENTLLNISAWPLGQGHPVAGFLVSPRGTRRYFLTQVSPVGRKTLNPVIQLLQPPAPPSDGLGREIESWLRLGKMRVFMKPGTINRSLESVVPLWATRFRHAT